MIGDISKILITTEQLAEKIDELGQAISSDYSDKNPLLIGILKGSVVFMADLMRAINIPVEIDFIAASSYGGSVKTSGVVRILKDLDVIIEGRHVLLVEDILDSGTTLSYIRENLLSRNPKSIKIVTLLDKFQYRKVEIAADYVGFMIGDDFVVGYGLDYSEKYRNLPFVGVLKPDIYR